MRDFPRQQAHDRGMAAPCRVHLLGAFAVDVDGRTIAPRSWNRESADLVKVLALAPSHHLEHDQVISRLWPTLPLPAAH